MNSAMATQARVLVMRMPTPLLVLFMTALSYVVTFPLYLFPYSSGTYAVPQIASLPPFWYFVTVVVVGPMIETALFQSLPLALLVKKLRVGMVLAGFVSAALFGATHAYNVQYVIGAFLVGLVLAGTFFVAQVRGLSPFWMVTAVHALRNAIVFVRVAL